MTKNKTLKKILDVLSPDETSVDFKLFDKQVEDLKTQLKEKIQVKTLDDVNNQIDKFRRRIDLDPLLETMGRINQNFQNQVEVLQSNIDSKSEELNTLLSENDSKGEGQITLLKEEIKNLKGELDKFQSVYSFDLSGFSLELEEFKTLEPRFKSSLSEVEKKFKSLLDESSKSNTDNYNLSDKRIVEIGDSLEKLRKDLNQRINNMHGGGNMNRQILVEGVDVLNKYTDINIYGATSSVLTSVDNVNKRVNIGIQGGGGGTPGGSDKQIQFNNNGSFGGTLVEYYISGNDVTLSTPSVVGVNGYSLSLVGSNVLSGTGDAGYTAVAGGHAGDDGIGGDARINGGDGGVNSGNGGFAFINAGDAIGGDSDGGGINLFSGVGHGTGKGGDIKITAKDGGASTGALGGEITIKSGAGGLDTPGGNIAITAATGGRFTFTSGAGSSGYFGAGDFAMVAGGMGGVSGNGGNFGLASGSAGSLTGDGGSIDFEAGGANAGNGGNINLRPGIGSVLGAVKILDPVSSVYAIFSTSILSADRTYTFPDKSGTFAMLSDISGSTGIVRSSSVITASQTGGGAVATDYVYFCAAGIKLTLPTAVGNSNLYTVKNTSASSVLVATTSAQTIDGSSSALMSVQNQSLDFISDNSNWNVI